jgi:hypothetical protein
MMINNSTNINKTNNHLSPQLIPKMFGLDRFHCFNITKAVVDPSNQNYTILTLRRLLFILTIWLNCSSLLLCTFSSRTRKLWRSSWFNDVLSSMPCTKSTSSSRLFLMSGEAVSVFSSALKERAWMYVMNTCI